MSDDVVSLLKSLRSDQGDFNENLRSKLLTLAEQPKLPPKRKTDMEVYNELSQNDPELAAIAMIESSGGKNYKHSMDPNSGMTAGGMFGMMPFTASDVVRLDKGIAEKYPDIVEYTKNLKESHPKITEFFNTNPEAAVEFAKSHYMRAKNRLGSPENAAYSWYNGISGALKAQKVPGKVENHEYVQKFKKLYKPVPTKIAQED